MTSPRIARVTSSTPNGRSSKPYGQSRSQSDVVFDGIKTMISAGQLQPGDRLPVEQKLSEQLGVSRGSLREGIRALALMGVLETRQGAGTYVTALDPDTLLGPLGVLVDLQRPETVVDLMSVRRVLEVEAAGRAAIRITAEELVTAGAALAQFEQLLDHDGIDHLAMMEADVEFHQVIARASGNATLAALIHGLAGRTTRARIWRALHEDGAERMSHAEHQAILAALIARDPDAARLRMGAHLLTVEDYLRRHLDADLDWTTS